jgi:hypothetical protein
VTSDNGNGAFTGPSLTDDEEADLRRRQNTQRVDQLEGEVAAIEDKLTGWKDALAAKKAELKEARSAKKGDE